MKTMSALDINILSRTRAAQCHMGSYSSVDTMKFCQLSSALLLVSLHQTEVLTLSLSQLFSPQISSVLVNSSPVPGGPLDFLFKEAPLLGPLAGIRPRPARRTKLLNIKTSTGLAGGSLVTAGLGFAGKNSILNTINTISNVANAKIGWEKC